VSIPQHLKGFETEFARSPRDASLAWFRSARFGLFMHYGLYALLGAGEWVMYNRKIPVAEYEKLKSQFDPKHFDADFIADLALAAGMKYVTLTTRHHDSFSLFRTSCNDWNSVSACGRDLVGELAGACGRRGLGLFLYYSYGADWWHPYFMPRTYSWMARPDYATPDPAYRFAHESDFRHYMDFVHTQLRELLTQYGPVAGVWFDPIMSYYGGAKLFSIDETYALIRSLQPHALISFKQGATGDEDFVAPERGAVSLVENTRRAVGEEAAAIAERASRLNVGKPREICNTLQPRAWGYSRDDDGHHRTAADVLSMLASARAANANLLLNTGPLPDGSISAEDVATLREVGAYLQHHDWPTVATHGEWTEKGRVDPNTAAAGQ
jgi:alpha-L-fucosidase